MKKSEDNKQKKREALFNTAFELFTTKGIHKTTISDIVQKAGVAKGTFYLYFSDKYDVRNKLISNKTTELFSHAHKALSNTTITDFQSKLIFIVDYIIMELEKNPSLLNFISKNLSWGVFKTALDHKGYKNTHNFYDLYLDMLASDEHDYKEPEIMLFTIIELVGATSYSCISYKEPLPIEEYKPYLYDTIRMIIKGHTL